MRDSEFFYTNVMGISIGKDFKTYRDQILYIASDSFDENGRPIDDESLADTSREILDIDTDDRGFTSEFLTKRKYRDTSLGGNDVINPYPQYGPNDDIVHSFFRTPNGVDSGMGRVYSSKIDDKKQILHITAGLPEFNSIANFFGDVIDTDLVNLMKGGSQSTANKIGSIIGTVLTTIIILPLIPIVFTNWVLKQLSSTKITKYYDLRPEMFLYYKFVNTIIISLAVNMGLEEYPDLEEGPGKEYNKPDNLKRPFDRFFTDARWDIFRILHRKYLYTFQETEDYEEMYTDAVFLEQMDYFKKNGKQQDLASLWEAAADYVTGEGGDGEEDNGPTWWDELFYSIKGNLYDSNMFISIGIEKSLTVSESFSNQTKESPVAAYLKQLKSNVGDLKNILMGGNISDNPLVNLLEGVAGFAGGAVRSATDVVGLGGVGHIASASGTVDIPEVYGGSTISKDYSFDITLQATCGNRMAIMQQIYIPLAMILGLALPRQVGSNAYVSPFIVKAYCKGMLSVPLGMIDSLNIKRGGDTHGWTNEFLPTRVDISFTIKDLSPAMYMGVGGVGPLSALGETSSFNEYLMTLSGMGTKERLTMGKRLRRATQIYLKIKGRNTYSPYAIGHAISDTSLMKAIGALVPGSLRPKN